MDVDTTLNGITTPVKLSFFDILDDFDVLAASGRLEMWKGKGVYHRSIIHVNENRC